MARQSEAEVHPSDADSDAFAPLIFDFDDTLIVSRADRGKLLLVALDSFGTPGSPDRVDTYWGRPFRDLVVGIAPSVERRYPDFLMHYADVLRLHPPTPCPGVVQALPVLAARHRLFVHSASNSRLVRTDLQSLGLLDLVDFVSGSDWQPVPKPDPRSFGAMRQLMDSALIDPASSWYIGDTVGDAVIASKAGLHFAGVAYNEEKRHSFVEHGVPPTHIIGSLSELQRLVDASSG
jgi:phosphoglycolate phosphatase-like HAD superfamily hydrolase